MKSDYPVQTESKSAILASLDDKVICEFQLSDELKDDAEEVIQYLINNNLNTYLLSGDIEAIVQKYAKTLQFKEAKGGKDPEEKLSYYSKWKQNVFFGHIF